MNTEALLSILKKYSMDLTSSDENFIFREIELIEKRRYKTKPSIKDNILHYLNFNKGEAFTATDIATKFCIPPQKASALLSQLRDEGEVDKIILSRRSYFSAVVI